MRAELPVNEAERLRALAELDVLDTPPEQDFDDIVALASQICATPVSLISLVDANRQWFKARVGLDEQESSRDVSFCAHAILGRDLLVVSDARTDARFADNPAVTIDPGIRFYAGAPLVTTDGFPVGTLCVVDRAPRRLNIDQIRALRALARQVTAGLELRRYCGTLKVASARLWRMEQHAVELANLAAGELRDPLRLIQAQLSPRAVDPRTAEALWQTISANLAPLRQLLDDLVDLSEPAREAGLRMRVVDLHELIRRAVEAVRPVGDVKGIPILHLPGAPLPVYGDPIRLDQALTHLLFTTVKFAPEGGRIEVSTEAEAGPTVRISDLDRADAPRPALFSHFYHAAIARPPDPSRTDAGLAAIKQVLDLHHVTVALCDQAGKGTSLHLTFPPAVPDTTERAEPRRTVDVDLPATAQRPVASSC